MITNSDHMKHTCHSMGCPNSHINTQYSPLKRPCRSVFSHANSHKGAECHPVIDCPKHLAPVIRPFERGRIVGLWEAGWTYRRIASHVGHKVSVMCRCFQQWSVEHSHTRIPGSGRSRSTDECQDRRIVRAVVAA